MVACKGLFLGYNFEDSRRFKKAGSKCVVTCVAKSVVKSVEKLVMKVLIFSILLFQMAPLFADLEVTEGWARATPPGMPMGAIYAKISNTGSSDIEIIGISTPVARAAEIHQSIEVEGMMRMREITPFIVSAGETVLLAPGGKHIMLMGLQEGLKQGDTFPLRLQLSNDQAVDVKVITGGFGQMSAPKH